MNNTDVWVRQGAYGTEEDAAAVSTWRRQGNTLTFPRIQGTDTVGTIAAVGDGVSPDRIGERVMVDFSIYNRDDDSLADIDYMGHGRDGGYAEYQAVPAENAHVVDTELSDVELATFCCAYLTGEQMLERAALKAGERVLVTGASGGVGSGIVQLARARGAIPYAVVGKGKEQAVRDIGAEAVITRGVGRPASRRERSDGRQADRRRGRPGRRRRCSTTSCASSGPRAATRRRARSPVRWCSSISAPCISSSCNSTARARARARDFRRIVRYIEAQEIRPLVGGVYRLSDFHKRAGRLHRQGFRRQAGGGAGRDVEREELSLSNGRLLADCATLGVGRQ